MGIVNNIGLHHRAFRVGAFCGAFLVGGGAGAQHLLGMKEPTITIDLAVATMFTVSAAELCVQWRRRRARRPPLARDTTNDETPTPH